MSPLRLLRPDRRTFLRATLRSGLGVSAWFLAGCPRGPGGLYDAGTPILGACDEAFEGGELLGRLGFVDENTQAFHEPYGQGHDGRLLTDLSLIQPGTTTTPTEHFYIRTAYPDTLDPNAPWSIRVDGLVDDEVTLSLADLGPLVVDQGVHVLECSGNSSGGGFGLLSAASWRGAPLLDVLEASGAGIRAEATRVLVSGYDAQTHVSTHSTPGASWVFTFEELARFGAFLATEMNGEPLPLDHGFPVRLYIPGWYGCTCIKWVDTLRLVNDDEPATAQMQEFASRTHQNGQPALARDYISASMDQAAMPVRVEKWRVAGEIRYRVVGILWGGYEVTDALTVRLGDDAPPVPVDVCPPQSGNQGWTVWTHAFRPTRLGEHTITCQIDDDSVPTRRLDIEWYARSVVIDEI